MSYAEFPTHINLREANEKYARKRGDDVPRNSDGSLKPFPSYRRKTVLFDAEQFRELDQYAEQVGQNYAVCAMRDVIHILCFKFSIDGNFCSVRLHKS